LHTQAPAKQAVVEQAVPSDGQVSASFGVETHWPLAGSQASSVQAFASLQKTARVPMHLPELHASLVQALPSEQGFVSSFVKTHRPSATSQASSVQGLPSSQAAGTPTHTPATQPS
jgi:hypothetical protein